MFAALLILARSSEYLYDIPYTIIAYIVILENKEVSYKLFT